MSNEKKTKASAANAGNQQLAEELQQMRERVYSMYNELDESPHRPGGLNWGAFCGHFIDQTLMAADLEDYIKELGEISAWFLEIRNPSREIENWVGTLQELQEALKTLQPGKTR